MIKTTKLISTLFVIFLIVMSSVSVLGQTPSPSTTPTPTPPSSSTTCTSEGESYLDEYNLGEIDTLTVEGDKVKTSWGLELDINYKSDDFLTFPYGRAVKVNDVWYLLNENNKPLNKEGEVVAETEQQSQSKEVKARSNSQKTRSRILPAATENYVGAFFNENQWTYNGQTLYKHGEQVYYFDDDGVIHYVENVPDDITRYMPEDSGGPPEVDNTDTESASEETSTEEPFQPQLDFKKAFFKEEVLEGLPIGTQITVDGITYTRTLDGWSEESGNGLDVGITVRSSDLAKNIVDSREFNYELPADFSEEASSTSPQVTYDEDNGELSVGDVTIPNCQAWGDGYYVDEHDNRYIVMSDGSLQIRQSPDMGDAYFVISPEDFEAHIGEINGPISAYGGDTYIPTTTGYGVVSDGDVYAFGYENGEPRYLKNGETFDEDQIANFMKEKPRLFENLKNLYNLQNEDNINPNDLAQLVDRGLVNSVGHDAEGNVIYQDASGQYYIIDDEGNIIAKGDKNNAKIKEALEHSAMFNAWLDAQVQKALYRATWFLLEKLFLEGLYEKISDKCKEDTESSDPEPGETDIIGGDPIEDNCGSQTNNILHAEISNLNQSVRWSYQMTFCDNSYDTYHYQVYLRCQAGRQVYLSTGQSGINQSANTTQVCDDNGDCYDITTGQADIGASLSEGGEYFFNESCQRAKQICVEIIQTGELLCSPPLLNYSFVHLNPGLKSYDSDSNRFAYVYGFALYTHQNNLVWSAFLNGTDGQFELDSGRLVEAGDDIVKVDTHYTTSNYEQLCVETSIPLGNPLKRINCISLALENSAPRFRNLPFSRTLQEDTPAQWDVSQYVVDLEGDAQLQANTNREDVVTASVTDQTITITPSNDYVGNASLNLILADDEYSDEASVLLNIVAFNDPPQLDQIDNIEMDEDEIKTVDISSFASDRDSPSLSYSCQSSANINCRISGNSLVLEPKENWFGEEGVVLTVSDGSLSDSTQITVVVNPVNDAPVVDLPMTLFFPCLNLPKDEQTVINLNNFVEDIDNPNSALSITETSSPGEISVSFQGLVMAITIKQEFSGMKLVQFSISDGEKEAISSFSVCCDDC